MIKINPKVVKDVVPGYVFKHAPFKFEPKMFVVEHGKLDGRLIQASTQKESLDRFMENPSEAINYIVTGNPSDAKALYFAAYLTQVHLQKTKNPFVLWEPVYGSWDNPGLKYSGITEPSLIVLTNLAENSTAWKIERAKDMAARFPQVPKIFVAAGEDPISFGATKLHIPCNAIAYFGSKLVKSVGEVI